MSDKILRLLLAEIRMEMKKSRTMNSNKKLVLYTIMILLWIDVIVDSRLTTVNYGKILNSSLTKTIVAKSFFPIFLYVSRSFLFLLSPRSSFFFHYFSASDSPFLRNILDFKFFSKLLLNIKLLSFSLSLCFVIFLSTFVFFLPQFRYSSFIFFQSSFFLLAEWYRFCSLSST